MELEGRTALVTGASGGLGPAMAAVLAREGAAVGLHYRTNKEAIEKVAAQLEEYRTFIVQGNLATHSGPPAICKEVEKTLGPIDILVNNGGGWVEKTLLETTDQEWDELLQADLRGSFLTTRHTAPGMKERGWGRIVNISTVAALNVVPREGAYGVAKAGVNMLTKTFAVELGGFGITVNSIAPAWTLSHDQPYPPRSEDYPQCTNIPDQRPGHAREIAALIRFLVSQEAAHINGQIIGVDGGLSAVLPASRGS